MNRHERLISELARHGLDAVAVVAGGTMRYLTGLDLHGGMRIMVAVFPASGEPAFVLPALEEPRARAIIPLPMRYYPWTDAEGPTAALAACARDLGLAGARLGIEYTSMRVFELRGIEAAAPSVEITDATPVFAALRMAKSADELASMRAAVQIVEGSLRAAIAQVRVGMTEIELGEIWDAAMRAAGSAPSFSTIIASGPNAANPHHTNSSRQLQQGDLVIMDGGAIYEGYASDITRTIALGEIVPELRSIYELTLAANKAGRAAVHPGVAPEQIDRAARGVISAGGYGPRFLHRTGHGLGIEIHEPPYIIEGNREPLTIGTTFTIEPGIYLDGLGGVRIEDDIVVTEQGGESLTTFERELIVI
ncbi:MAG: aminopeptidase P family protein [Roseiflexaceae bacterium]|nr:aminopeptidase P family protein [Roseiflexaceae bacterium]